MVPKVIAVDLDGPCYEWDRTAQYMLRTYRGANVHQPSPSWDWIEKSVNPVDWAWLWSEGVKLGLFRHGHVTTGAIVNINRLKQAGHKLVVITHRPESAVRDTINWMDHHFGNEDPYPWSGFYMLHNGESKADIKADILIDDKPSNVFEWAKLPGRQAILFDRPHNQLYQMSGDVLRGHGWDDVVGLVEAL